MYHPNGAVKSFTYGNGITHTMSQNTRGLPEWSEDAGILKDQYGYDANGNVTMIADWQQGISNRGLSYDNLDRLASVNAPSMWGDAFYTYNALDNLTSTRITAGGTARTTTHTYDPATNLLQSVSNSAGPDFSFSYQYDSQGNIIQRGSQSYVFDMANRLTSPVGNSTCTYDGFGRMVSVVGTDGVNRVLVYSQSGQMLYATVTGNPLAAGTKYVYLHNHVVAEVGGGVQYDHTDGLGSPIAATDGARAVISRTRYEPYGQIQSGPAGTFGFTGHLNAADLGLVYMQQRYYDPVAGRFLSIDPVTTDANTGGSFNRYSYALNNPYRYVDPDGRQAQCAARDNGGQTCTIEVNTNMAGAAALTAFATIWNAGVGVYEAVSRNSNSSQSTTTDSSKAKDKEDSFSVRVQAQGTSLKNDASVPLIGSTPIKADAVQFALKVTQAQLTPKEQEQMAPAFERASKWVESARAAGGVSVTGTSKSFDLPGVSRQKARVDIEVIRGPINIVP